MRALTSGCRGRADQRRCALLASCPGAPLNRAVDMTSAVKCWCDGGCISRMVIFFMEVSQAMGRDGASNCDG